MVILAVAAGVDVGLADCRAGGHLVSAEVFDRSLSFLPLNTCENRRSAAGAAADAVSSMLIIIAGKLLGDFGGDALTIGCRRGLPGRRGPLGGYSKALQRPVKNWLPNAGVRRWMAQLGSA